MKIAFFCPHLCLQGTTVAIYDYANYNEILLNNESYIIYEKNEPRNNQTTIKKCLDRFKNRLIDIPSIAYLDNTLIQNKIDAVYIIKPGYKNDGRNATACKTLIHAVGMAPPNEIHGDAYAYISYWLSEECSNGQIPAVPHMIDLPSIDSNLREQFNIPKDAIVFGRNGGLYSWNLKFVEEVILEVISKRDDIYFIFQNTPQFSNHERIINIEATADMNYKVKFINTCDAMLHARHEGESFGLSCGEFSSKNKPVITWGLSRERNHIYILKDKGIYYTDKNDLTNILLNFKKEPYKNWDAYQDYSPEKIMKIFDKVFLK